MCSSCVGPPGDSHCVCSSCVGPPGDPYFVCSSCVGPPGDPHCVCSSCVGPPGDPHFVCSSCVGPPGDPYFVCSSCVGPPGDSHFVCSSCVGPPGDSHFVCSSCVGPPGDSHCVCSSCALILARPGSAACMVHTPFCVLILARPGSAAYAWSIPHFVCSSCALILARPGSAAYAWSIPHFVCSSWQGVDLQHRHGPYPMVHTNKGPTGAARHPPSTHCCHPPEPAHVPSLLTSATSKGLCRYSNPAWDSGSTGCLGPFTFFLSSSTVWQNFWISFRRCSWGAQRHTRGGMRKTQLPDPALHLRLSLVHCVAEVLDQLQTGLLGEWAKAAAQQHTGHGQMPANARWQARLYISDS